MYFWRKKKKFRKRKKIIKNIFYFFYKEDMKQLQFAINIENGSSMQYYYQWEVRVHAGNTTYTSDSRIVVAKSFRCCVSRNVRMPTGIVKGNWKVAFDNRITICYLRWKGETTGLRVLKINWFLPMRTSYIHYSCIIIQTLYLTSANKVNHLLYSELYLEAVPGQKSNSWT